MNSFPHDSVNHDRTYSSADFRNYFLPLVRNGVFANPANSCMVMTVNDNRKVTIRAGRCYINGCIGYTDGIETVEIPLPDDNYPRYDIIAARLDLVNRDIHIELIKGTPSGSPMYPELSRTSLKYDLALAAIKSSPSVYEITQDCITDLRFNDEYCGIVTSIVDTIDTADLFAQYEARWNMLMAGFSGDEAAIIAAFNSLLTVKSVNGVAPADSGGNVTITLDDIPDGTAKKLDKTVKCGTVTTTNNSGQVIFDTPFTNVPIVIATAECNPDGSLSQGTLVGCVSTKDITAEGFTVIATGTATSGVDFKVHWIAMGV